MDTDRQEQKEEAWMKDRLNIIVLIDLLDLRKGRVVDLLAYDDRVRSPIIELDGPRLRLSMPTCTR